MDCTTHIISVIYIFIKCNINSKSITGAGKIYKFSIFNPCYNSQALVVTSPH